MRASMRCVMYGDARGCAGVQRAVLIVMGGVCGWQPGVIAEMMAGMMARLHALLHPLLSQPPECLPALGGNVDTGYDHSCIHCASVTYPLRINRIVLGPLFLPVLPCQQSLPLVPLPACRCC